MSQSDIETSSASRFTGRVKWFNNKSGYGFITASTGDIKGTDIFVHHSSIVVSDQQYKYLVQGEYVEFSLNELSSGKHKYQATDISGIAKGQLMCETRREVRALRPKPNGDKKTAKSRGPGPRDEESAEVAPVSDAASDESIQSDAAVVAEEGA